MRGPHINQEDSEKTCPELLRNRGEPVKGPPHQTSI
jgi:hypothetical protein